MAIRAVTMDQVVDYVSKEDPAKGTPQEADDATFFQLGTLSARMQAKVKDAATSFRADPESVDPKNPQMTAEFRPNESVILMVKFGLKGFRNFKDSNGNDVPFKTEQFHLGGQSFLVVSDDTLNFLGLELIRELSEVIEKSNTPNEADLKP